MVWTYLSLVGISRSSCMPMYIYWMHAILGCQYDCDYLRLRNLDQEANVKAKREVTLLRQHHFNKKANKSVHIRLVGV